MTREAWRSDIRRRYESVGRDAFQPAQAEFARRLQEFFTTHGISFCDKNSEGQDWLIRLRDGTEIYVPWESYELDGEDSDVWVEYRPEHGGVVAHFTGMGVRRSGYE